jgi:hypothetical protein
MSTWFQEFSPINQSFSGQLKTYVLKAYLRDIKGEPELKIINFLWVP